MSRAVGLERAVDQKRSSGPIVVGIDGLSSAVHAVPQAAFDEARLLNATLLALKVPSSRIDGVPLAEVDRLLTEQLGRYPDVQTQILVAPQGISSFIAERDPPVQLAVLHPAGSPMMVGRARAPVRAVTTGCWGCVRHRGR